MKLIILLTFLFFSILDIFCFNLLMINWISFSFTEVLDLLIYFKSMSSTFYYSCDWCYHYKLRCFSFFNLLGIYSFSRLFIFLNFFLLLFMLTRCIYKIMFYFFLWIFFILVLIICIIVLGLIFTDNYYEIIQLDTASGVLEFKVNNHILFSKDNGSNESKSNENHIGSIFTIFNISVLAFNLIVNDILLDILKGLVDLLANANADSPTSTSTSTSTSSTELNSLFSNIKEFMSEHNEFVNLYNEKGTLSNEDVTTITKYMPRKAYFFIREISSNKDIDPITCNKITSELKKILLFCLKIQREFLNNSNQ